MTESSIFSDQNTNDMNTNQLTGIRIKEERLRLNYSQQALADHLGMDISNYSRLENGKIEITIAKLEAIAEFFKVPLVRLLPINMQGSVNINNGTAIINGNSTMNHTNINTQDLNAFFEKIVTLIQNFKKEI
jgi:transcriptional regulator with XRE-family HTH domain